MEISPVPRLHMVLSKKRITKALISLRGCAGWSAPVFFANPRRQVLSRRGQIMIKNGPIGINPYKPGVLFVGHRQTVQNQIRVIRPQGYVCFHAQLS